MRRRVIQIANFTKIISLPARWIKAHQIERGDEVEVEERAGSLLIHALGSPKANLEAELNIKDKRKFHKILLIKLYIEGYDRIRINFADPSVLDDVEKALDLLLGFEMINQGDGFCIIQNVASAEETEFSKILKRMFHIINTGIKDSESSLGNKRIDSFPDLEKTDRLINRFSYLCERILNKSFDKRLYEYYLVCQLELIADHYKYISQDVRKSRTLSDNLKAAYRDVNGFFSRFSEIYYKKYDIHESIALEQKIRNKLIEFNELLSNLNEKEEKIMQHLFTIMSAIRHMNSRLNKLETI